MSITQKSFKSSSVDTSGSRLFFVSLIFISLLIESRKSHLFSSLSCLEEGALTLGLHNLERNLYILRDAYLGASKMLGFSLDRLYLQGVVSFQWSHTLCLISSYIICSIVVIFLLWTWIQKSLIQSTTLKQKQMCVKWEAVSLLGFDILFAWEVLEFCPQLLSLIENSDVTAWKLDQWREYPILQRAARDSVIKVIKDHHIGSNLTSIHLTVCYWKICGEDKFKPTTKYFMAFRHSNIVYLLQLIQSLLGSFHLCLYT